MRIHVHDCNYKTLLTLTWLRMVRVAPTLGVRSNLITGTERVDRYYTDVGNIVQDASDLVSQLH